MKFLSTLLLSAVLALPGGAQTFRFALLSDLHLSPGTTGAEDLQRAVDQINATDSLAFVLVAGDFTDNGDRASLLEAKAILDRLKIDYYATSGNHETKWSESGATDFARIYGSDRFRFEYGGFLFLGFNSGPVIRMMEGHVAPQDLAWVEENLREAGPDQPVFLVTHYPMAKGDVDNWYTVTDAVRPYNIRAFLGGHYHADRLAAYDGIPAFICRSTLRGNYPAGGYSVFEVSADSIVVYEHRIGGRPVRWGGYSLRTPYYTADTDGYERPDFSVNARYGRIGEKWTTRTEGAIYSSPVLYDRKVYVGDDNGALHCFRFKDGKEMWTFRSGARIVGTPAAADGLVAFGSADGCIYGVNARTGALVWKVRTDEAVLGAATIDDGTLYIGCSDGKFRALELKTGREVWTYDGLRGYVETRPLLYGDKVVFGAWDCNLYALDRRTGKEAWKWNEGHTRMHYSPAAVWPVATEGRIFIAAPDRVLSAIDARTGQTLWRTKESTVRETVALSADSSRIYSKTMRDSVVCFSTRGTTPRKLWAANVGFGYEIAPSMPVEKEGTLFGSTMNGEIFALEAETGRLLWRHKVSNCLVSTVVPIDGHSCLFTSSDGIVGLLRDEE